MVIRHETDWVVGRVMQALQKNGQAENTLIIFSADKQPQDRQISGWNPKAWTCGIISRAKMPNL